MLKPALGLFPQTLSRTPLEGRQVRSLMQPTWGQILGTSSQNYDIPDGLVVTAGTERCRAPGKHEGTWIYRCHMDVRKGMHVSKCIILAGTLFSFSRALALADL